MGTTTPVYGFFKPAPEDSMADVKKNINDNFRAMLPITKYPSVTTLPTLAGGATVGQVVYHSVEQSIYICIVADPNWGAHWRPLHSPKSPFVDVPASVVVNPAQWKANFKLSYDNVGQVYWKGNLEWVGPAAIPDATDMTILKVMPKGVRPFMRSIFPLSTDPNITTKPFNDYNGAFAFLSDKNFEGGISYFRASTEGVEKFIWLDNIFYAVGEGNFVNA